MSGWRYITTAAAKPATDQSMVEQEKVSAILTVAAPAAISADAIEDRVEELVPERGRGREPALARPSAPW